MLDTTNPGGRIGGPLGYLVPRDAVLGCPKTSRPLNGALIWSLVELFGLTPELRSGLNKSFRCLLIQNRSRQPFSTLGLLPKMV